MTVAFVLGGAVCVYADYEAACLLTKPDIVIAVNDIGVTWPSIDYMASYHTEVIPYWLSLRRKRGLLDPKHVFAYKSSCVKNIGLPYTILTPKGGSSGMLGTEGALSVADKVILCGIPLNPDMNNIVRPAVVGWSSAIMYRRQWEKNKKRYEGRVKSMSGWTKQLLGEPTAEWLK